ncbi:MAG: hypothetical protein GWN71_23055, partial [Gammaproteobacteria bacterium]|nr:hypothetical protein [Gemmatimonadota bacterium]NIR38363.1 hypothetical protein [Actinomycetota bacterium]NIU76332.1 hypothetical protein [Gammaproteobacteria bacterium]NIX22184.1 hypothetical protein [Actinomycetota bacterium]
MNTLDPRGAPLFLLALVLSACSGSSTPVEVEEPVPTTLTLAPTSVELTYIGQSRSVSAVVLDQSGSTINGAVTWSSQHPDVATVSDVGVVR